MATGGLRPWFQLGAALLTLAILAIGLPGRASALPRQGPVGVSDDFEAANIDLDTWTVVDPSGIGQASLALGTLAFAPGGEAWEEDRSIRIEQPIEDSSFDLAFEFPAIPVTDYTAVGATLQGRESWLQIGFTGTGGATSVVAISNQDEAPLVRLKQPVDPDQVRLRIRRQGPQYVVWTAAESGDWRPAGTFVEDFVVERLALFGAARDLDAETVAIADFAGGEPAAEPRDDTDGPLIQSVVTRSSGDDLVVSFFTDEPARGSVAVGSEIIDGDSAAALQHEVVVPDVENGATVTFEPRAEDAAGNTTIGEPNELRFTREGLPVIDVWYGDRQEFGRNGVPQRWVNILGNVSDDDGVTELSYTLDGGPRQPLDIGPSDRRLANEGDFNADLLFDEMQPGEHVVELRATDSLGNTNTRSVTVVLARTLGPALPHEIVWADAASPNDVAQVVDGNWVVEEDGSLRTAEIGYDRLVAVGDREMTDYEIVFPVVMHEVSEEGYGEIDGTPGMGLTVGWTGHWVEDETQPPWGYWPSSGEAALNWDTLDETSLAVAGNNATPQDSVGPVRIPLGEKIWTRVRVEKLEKGPQISMKAWLDGTAEPAGWAVSVTGTTGSPDAGSVAIVAHHVDVSIGDVLIEQLSE